MFVASLLLTPPRLMFVAGLLTPPRPTPKVSLAGALLTVLL